MPLIDETPFYQDFLKPPEDRGLELILESMMAPPLTSDIARRVNFYNSNPLVRQKLQTHYKSYPHSKMIPLGNVLPSSMTLERAIQSRGAQRNYKDQPMTMAQLSHILKVGYCPRQSDHLSKRTAPSGGGRHPTEIYPLIFNVEGLEPGAYHFNPKHQALELIKAGNLSSKLDVFFDTQQDTLENVSAIFIVTSVYRRTTEKYGERGWKILLMDIGHIGQNFWLLANSLGLGFYPITAANEHDLAKYLNINKYFEVPLVAYCMGLQNE